MGIIKDHQLFITGRYKDAIIINGVNYYPHDIEDAVSSSCGAARPGSVVAFPYDDDGEERLIVMLELAEINKVEF